MKITKLNFKHLLLLLCSFVFATNASAQTFEVNAADWIIYSETNDFSVGSIYLQSAVTDGAIFTLPAPTATSDMHPESPANQQCTKGYKIYKSGSNVVAETFSGGSALEHYPVKRASSTNPIYYYMGPAIAADDAGTLWSHTMRGDEPGTNADWRVGIHTFTYYTERPGLGVTGTKKTINLDNVTGTPYMQGITYLMSANGDGANGTGYIWIAAASAKIARYTISNGAYVAKDTYTTPLSGGTSPASYYCYVKQHGNKVYYTTPAYDGSTMTAQAIYRGELSADGLSITWESTPVVTDNYSPQFGVFTLCGHDILVYNSLDESYSYSPYREITIYDMTAKLVISVQKPIFVPSNNNYIRQSINATEVDENNAYIYGVIPSVGVYRYPVVATPMEVSVECEISDVCNERQDAIVSWTAAQSATAYKVYYQSTYTNGQGETITTDWAEVGETSTTSIAHENVCWATVLENDDRKYYERSYKYKVVPVYASGALGTETVSSSITPEFIPSSPVWVEVNPVKDYEGYCIVQLLWKEWHGYGCQPHHYNVIRDGKAINLRENETLEIGGSNYVDTTCISGAIYNYHIEAAYPGVDIPDEYSNHLTNEDREVEIAIRDWSKPRYSISKIYEYKIVDREYESEEYPGYDGVVRPDATEFPNFYTEPDCYRQGVYYNGCWYIAQYTNDNTADKFQDYPQLEETTVKGGILRFLGRDPRKDVPDSVTVYPTTYPKKSAGKDAAGKEILVDVDEKDLKTRRPLVSYHRENQCIAVDKSGTFLTRGLRTGWTGNVNLWEDNHNYALVCSSVEYHNFDKNWHGSFDLPDNLVKELEASAVDASLRVGDDTRPGRVDYFSAQGDLYNDKWCYLYMAPMVSKTVFRVKLTKSGNTVKVNEGDWVKFTENGTNPNFTYATENYAFPINCEGREGEEYVYEQLTNVYSLLSGDGTTQKQSADDRAIYESSTFVNTIGGTTFEFNNELLLAVPQGQYPGNTGSFLVGMANRFTENNDGSWTNNGAAKADMTEIIPTAQWYTGKANADATETNGLWIYGEQAKDANGNIIDKNKDGMTDYAYIYTYRPGVMFGKYILTPTTQFPPSQVILSIDPLYETDKETDNGTDILRYDATASWKDVENYATSGGNFYEIEGYTFSLYDVEKRDGNEGGEIINVTFNMTGLNPDGTITDNKGEIVEGLTYTPYTMVENGVEKTYYEYTYVKEDVDAVDDNCEKRDFIAYVTVNYKGLPGQSTEGLSFNSAQTEYIDANAYVPELPQATTTIYKETYIVPKDTDGDNKPDTDFQFYYFYMDMVEPKSEDPVTNYTITVDKGNGEVETLDKFYLYDPEGTTGLTPNKDGYVEITAEYDENGNLITPAAIPGTYDFDAARTAIAAKNNAENTTHQQIIKWQVGDIVGPDDTDGDNSPIEGDEAKWKITVNAHYANTNAKISYSTNGGETLYYKDGTLTGVESPLCSSDISVYPNPAESYIIVKSPSVIGKLSIHAADGREMRTIDVEDTSVQINVENLSKGIYVIKVNGITKKFSKK